MISGGSFSKPSVPLKEKGVDDALIKGGKLEELIVADRFSVLIDENLEKVKNVWETEN